MSDELNESRKRLHAAIGELDYHLELFGDFLAKKEKIPLDGMDAIHFFLVQKHNWLPRDVRSMSGEDIRLVLANEMKGWTVKSKP